EALRKELAQNTEDLLHQAGAAKANNTNSVNTVSTPVSTANVFSTDRPSADYDESQIHALEDIYENSCEGIFTNLTYDDEGAEADFTNSKNTMIHCLFPCFLSQIEPKKISEALQDESCHAMQEELLQFKLQK
ncbi:hypothetical protein Tco_0230515, partial [Tanacetum coccineum]